MSDTISRQDAINKCQERLYESALNNVGYECKADEVFADIAQNRIKTWLNEVPSARPEQRWIPCSEKLPEDGQNVLVTYKTTNKIHPCQYHDDGSRNPWYSYIDQCRAYMNVVTAWMPLPEPYREERTEE